MENTNVKDSHNLLKKTNDGGNKRVPIGCLRSEAFSPEFMFKVFLIVTVTLCLQTLQFSDPIIS